MTKLLQRAIEEIEKLPVDQQDTIASRILADLEDEKTWAARFESTTDNQWDRLAKEYGGRLPPGIPPLLTMCFRPAPRSSEVECNGGIQAMPQAIA